jgi:hypothetical protein
MTWDRGMSGAGAPSLGAVAITDLSEYYPSRMGADELRCSTATALRVGVYPSWPAWVVILHITPQFYMSILLTLQTE